MLLLYRSLRMSMRLLDYFTDVTDPRIERTKLHKLEDILAIAICAIICGAEGWTEMAFFGQCKQQWLETFLELPNGIPSDDTFRRVISALQPNEFEACFQRWTKAVSNHQSDIIAIDGKTLRRSHNNVDGKSAIHIVSAWACENKMVFGQVATDEKSNEITAIPKLLEMLVLDGSVVTIDAMGCQKKIAEKIKESNGDYIFSLKGNQGTLHEEVKLFMDDAITNSGDYDYNHTTDGGHGRVEIRKVWYSQDIQWIQDRKDWLGLSSLIAVESQRIIGDKVSTERRYFISSLSGIDAETIGRMIRSHWGIENKLHWSLDVSFGEDDSRIRKGFGAENVSRLRRIALNLLKQEKTAKCGIKIKQHKAGWDEKYLQKILGI
ncbi:MAG: ISAs1 family transposase [Sedimentisphaerales bacterium]